MSPSETTSVLVLFGATGNLAKKMLFPALYRIEERGALHQRLIGVSRNDWDDERFAAARVSVVATIGYTAFLAGPPLLGLLGDRFGVLQALLVVAVLLVPAMAVVPAARPLQPETSAAPVRH